MAAILVIGAAAGGVWVGSEGEGPYGRSAGEMATLLVAEASPAETGDPATEPAPPTIEETLGPVGPDGREVSEPPAPEGEVSPPSIDAPSPPFDTGAITASALESALETGSRSLLLSPVGLDAVLQVIEAGSSGTGEQADRPDSGGTGGMIARDGALGSWIGIWIAHTASVDRDVAAQIHRRTGASVERIDFTKETAGSEIDAWFAERSDGRIDAVVGAVPSQSTAVVAHALSYAAPWHIAFDAALTEPAPFARPEALGGPLAVSTMRFEGEIGFAEGPFGQLVEITMEHGNGRMRLVLPAEDGEEANADAVAALLDAREPDVAVAAVALPRIAVEGQVDLLAGVAASAAQIPLGNSPVLDALAEPAAPLSAIEQRVRIDLDETGVVTTATTVGIASTISEITPAISVVFDRPFLFAIHHDAVTGPLVVGYLADPGSGARDTIREPQEP